VSGWAGKVATVTDWGVVANRGSDHGVCDEQWAEIRTALEVVDPATSESLGVLGGMCGCRVREIFPNFCVLERRGSSFGPQPKIGDVVEQVANPYLEKAEG